MICIDAWANINESLQKHGAKYKGDGIGTTYSGWVALCEIVYPRVHQLLKAEREKVIKDTIKEIRLWEKRFKGSETDFENFIDSIQTIARKE